MMLTVAIAIAIAIATGDVVLDAWVGALRGFQVDAFIAASLFLIFVLMAVRRRGCGDVLRGYLGGP